MINFVSLQYKNVLKRFSSKTVFLKVLNELNMAEIPSKQLRTVSYTNSSAASPTVGRANATFNRYHHSFL